MINCGMFYDPMAGIGSEPERSGYTWPESELCCVRFLDTLIIT